MTHYRRIIIDGTPTGMQGLDALFESLYQAGHRPAEPALGSLLVQVAQKDNYIPAGAIPAFAAALLREFQHYAELCERGDAPQSIDYGTWHGYPREQIPWFPSVNDDLCNGCGICLRLCATQALVSTPEGKVTVGDPFRCVVGCSSCANVCRPRAITFPPRSLLQAYRRRA